MSSFSLKILRPIILIFFLSACDKDCTIPDEPHKIDTKRYKYAYTNTHETEDIQVYVGPKGERLSNEQGHTIFDRNTALGVCPYRELIIDKDKDSLYLKSKKTIHSYILKLSNDTIWHTDNEYWGIVSNEKEIVLNKAFYFINYKGILNEDSNTWYGGQRGYSHAFGKANINKFFNKNSVFNSLSNMTMESDTIACLTEYYIFTLTD